MKMKICFDKIIIKLGKEDFMIFFDKNYKQLSYGDFLLFDNGCIYKLINEEDVTILQNITKIMPRLFAENIAQNGVFVNAIRTSVKSQTDK